MTTQTEEQVHKLNSALAKYKTDLSYFTRELRDIDSKLEKVASDQQSAAARLNAANGSDERQMRESNSGFQSQRQSMYASIKQNLEAGKSRSELLPLPCPRPSNTAPPVYLTASIIEIVSTSQTVPPVYFDSFHRRVASVSDVILSIVRLVPVA